MGLRTVILGAGLMGEWHARYARRCGAEIVAIADRDLARANRLKSIVSRQATVASSLDDCLAKGGVEAVHICTPVATHFEAAVAALNERCHVLVEKPATKRLAEAIELTELAARNSCLLVPVLQFRFQRGVQRMLSKIDEFGAPQQLSMTVCTAGADLASGAGKREVLWEIAPHFFSLARGLLGAEVLAAPPRVFEFSEDALIVDVQCGTRRADLMLSASGRPTRNELRLIGSRGSAYADLFHGYCLTDFGRIGRAGKILRPIRLGLGHFGASLFNLGWRFFHGHGAYPGLPELIASFHKSASGRGDSPISLAEICDVARMQRALREQMG